MVSTRVVERRRAQAKALRGHDRALTAAVAIESFTAAVAATTGRTTAERIAEGKRRPGMVSWGSLALGSHR